jgi:transketolase
MKTIQKIDLRIALIEKLIEEIEKNNKNIIILVGDSTSTSKIAPLQEKFPNHVINVGIAEQNLVGVAAGLSLGGHIAITANAAPFLVARSNEQIKNDVCYSNSNVKLIGLNAGVSYGSLGSTHHAIDDISIMKGFGNIQIFAPSDSIETKQIIEYAINYIGPVYIRLDNAAFPVMHSDDYKFKPGEVDILKEGKDISIIAMGSVVHEAYDAADELKNKSIDPEILNISSIRPLNPEKIIASIKKTKKVVTVEEHSLHGGLASIISDIIAEENLQTKLIKLGIPEGHFSVAGPRNEIRKHYNLDKEGIINSALKLVK